MSHQSMHLVVTLLSLLGKMFIHNCERLDYFIYNMSFLKGAQGNLFCPPEL